MTADEDRVRPNRKACPEATGARHRQSVAIMTGSGDIGDITVAHKKPR